MLKLKEMKNIKINNYADFNGWDITEKEVREYINNLTLNDLEIGDFNYFNFIKYNEEVEVFIYYNAYEELIINIEDIF